MPTVVALVPTPVDRVGFRLVVDAVSLATALRTSHVVPFPGSRYSAAVSAICARSPFRMSLAALSSGVRPSKSSKKPTLYGLG